VANALRDQLEDDFLAWGNSYVMQNTEVRELWASVIAVEARLDRDKVASA
jgi:hypothetical protein